MFFAAGRIRPIVLTAAFLVFGSFGHAHALEQQERNWNHGVIVVAQAETPSNTCARERTECLRARVQKGILGSEYVPPDDTARCQAAYRACLSGQQQSVQPAPRSPTSPDTHDVLAGVRKFSIGKMEWEINGGVATYRQVYPGPATSVVTARGTVSPNRIEGTMVWTFPGDPCHIRQSEHFVYVFDAENVSARNQPGPVEVRGSCKGWDKMTRGSSFTAPWRKVE